MTESELLLAEDMPYPLASIEQWCGGIDALETDKTYNVTGMHLKQLLMSYRMLCTRLAEKSAGCAYCNPAKMYAVIGDPRTCVSIPPTTEDL